MVIAVLHKAELVGIDTRGSGLSLCVNDKPYLLIHSKDYMKSAFTGYKESVLREAGIRSNSEERFT